MRIATMIHGSGVDFESRKRVLARKEMDQAYKKHAKYAEVNKNSMLAALENLLSGKTDKEVNAPDQAIRQLTATEHDVLKREPAHKAAGVGVTGAVSYTRSTGLDYQEYIIDGEVSTQAPPTDGPDDPIQVLEQLRQAALAPARPSAQDLRVAASAAVQIQVVRGEVQAETLEDESDVEPYANEEVSFNVPERFQTSVQRDPEAVTLFGRDLEQLIFKRMFKKATEKYMSHVAMVRNSYLAYNEPQFLINA